MEKEEVIRRLYKHLERVIPEECEKTDHAYFVHRPWGYVRFSLGYGGIWHEKREFNAGVTCIVRINEIEKYWEEFSELVNVKFAASKINPIHTYTISPGIYRVNNRFAIDINGGGSWNFSIDDDGFEKYEMEMLSLIEDQYITMVKETLNLKYLDNSINSVVEINQNLENYILNRDGLIFRRIILARLTGNNLYETICEYQRSAFSEYRELAKRPAYNYFYNLPVVFEKVYERLKTVQQIDQWTLEY